MTGRRDFFKKLGFGTLAAAVAPKVLSAETKEVLKTTFKVRARFNVYHGVTQELTCKEGAIFTVVDVKQDPICEDFRAIGKIPAPGKWYQFEETGEQIHRADLFVEVSTFEVNREIKTEHLHVSGPQYFHYEAPISEYDRETYMRLDELVKRKS